MCSVILHPSAFNQCKQEFRCEHWHKERSITFFVVSYVKEKSIYFVAGDPMKQIYYIRGSPFFYQNLEV